MEEKAWVYKLSKIDVEKIFEKAVRLMKTLDICPKLRNATRFNPVLLPANYGVNCHGEKYVKIIYSKFFKISPLDKFRIEYTDWSGKQYATDHNYSTEWFELHFDVKLSELTKAVADTQYPRISISMDKTACTDELSKLLNDKENKSIIEQVENSKEPMILRGAQQEYEFLKVYKKDISYTMSEEVIEVSKRTNSSLDSNAYFNAYFVFLNDLSLDEWENIKLGQCY